MKIARRVFLCAGIFDLAGKSDRFNANLSPTYGTGYSHASTTAATCLRSHPWLGTPAPILTADVARCRRGVIRWQGSRLANICCPPGDTYPGRVASPAAADSAEGDGWLLAALARAGKPQRSRGIKRQTDVEGRPGGPWCNLGQAIPR